MEIPTEKPEDFLYAWFSQKCIDQAKSMGPQQQFVQGYGAATLPPRTVHPMRHFGRLEDGTEVEFSCLTEGPDHGTGWDDIVFVGLVRKAHRRHERLDRYEFKIPKTITLPAIGGADAASG